MKKTRKALAVVLATLMVLALIPMTAFAADGEIAFGETKTVVIPEADTATLYFTPDESNAYVVYSVSDDDPYIEVYDSDEELIAKDDDNYFCDSFDFYCIFYAEEGCTYEFVIGEINESEADIDVTIAVYGEIEHHQETDKPYVEVTDGADAEYQWYRIVSDFVEVTDENATASEGNDYSGEYASYDSENGWTGIATYTYDEDVCFRYNFFTLSLKEGQTINMTTDTYSHWFAFQCDCEGYDYQYCSWINLEADETVTFTATHDCDKFYAYGFFKDVPHLKAEINDVEKVDGATDKEFDADTNGEYFCAVTFDGFRTEFSDAFEFDASKIRIAEASINFRTDVAGMNVSDYEDYIEILTEGLQFEDDYGDPAVYVVDPDTYDLADTFENGKTYYVNVYLSAESGYRFGSSIEGYMNGEEAYSYLDSWFPGEEYGDIEVDYVCIEFEFTATEPCGHMCHRDGFMGFIWSIINFFCRIFGANPVCECGTAHY